MKNKFIYSFIFFLFATTLSIEGQQLHNLKTHELIDRQLVNEIHAEKIAKIQIQDFQGRIKPISTLSLELLRKIYGKSKFTYLDKKHNKKKALPYSSIYWHAI